MRSRGPNGCRAAGRPVLFCGRDPGIWYSAILMKRRFLSLERSCATLLLLTAFFLCPICAPAQRATEAPAKPESRAAERENFLSAADEVLQQVSALTHLSLRTPVKKSLRSREEIRAYLLRRMKEDKSEELRYADERVAVAFGLVPKDFQMEPFLVELLTEQIAGLYDPDNHEFYIADWIPLEDQRMVMAHELTHALEDQHFQIDKWLKAARPNDDGELAREAVLEGSATAAMIDYLLQATGRSLKELPDLDPELLIGELGDTPALKKAPPFIKDALVFPYFSGLRFSKAILEQSGWDGLAGVFARPPATSQQILHPELYREGRVPPSVELPFNRRLLTGEWKQLADNAWGEFGWREVLQQFLGKERAVLLAKEWAGDRYLLLEEARTKKLLVVCRLRLSNAEAARRFFSQYSEALEKKHPSRRGMLHETGFFSFETPEDGGVFLRCAGQDCLVIEGGTRGLFDEVTKRIGWNASAKARAEDPRMAVAQKNPAEIAAFGWGNSARRRKLFLYFATEHQKRQVVGALRVTQMMAQIGQAFGEQLVWSGCGAARREPSDAVHAKRLARLIFGLGQTVRVEQKALAGP